MLAKRIIPCLDVNSNGRVVKGINFVSLRDAGDPVQLAKTYSDEGADEIVFLDITATHEQRKTIRDVIRKTAENVFVPLTVGGGIRTIEDFTETLRAGADKVGINSAAVRDPSIIAKAADKFGSQCVVLAVDAKKREDSDSYEVVINGGRIRTGIDLLEWVEKGQELGAGEILLTSMDADGTKQGFDCPMLQLVSSSVNIPVIASGGCGNLSHFSEVFEKTGADAALAATLFHFGELTITEVKDYLRDRGIPIRS